jgi:hypothetical protein
MSSSKILTFFLVLATVGMLFTLEGCGGGSAGTGFDTQDRSLTIEGALLSSNNEPLSGVVVTVVETGSSTITDATGVFSLNIPPVTGNAELTFERGEESGGATVPLAKDATSVQIVVTLTPELTKVEENSYSMTSKIGGDCSSYFSDESPIKQISEVPPSTQCTAVVQVLNGDIPASGVPFAVQYRGCNENDPWITLALGETGSDENAGKGEVPFTFTNDTLRCVYRIVAPFNIDGATLVAKEIQTLRSLSNPKAQRIGRMSAAQQFGHMLKLVDF